MQEMWVQSLRQEGPLEKEMAAHSSILAWEIPWTEELGGYSSRGHKESDTTQQLNNVRHCFKCIIPVILAESLAEILAYEVGNVYYSTLQVRKLKLRKAEKPICAHRATPVSPGHELMPV